MTEQETETIIDAFQLIEDIKPNESDMTPERSAQAALVADNPEWRQYVVGMLDYHRSHALVQDAENTDVLRGRILALADAYEWFNNRKVAAQSKN